MPAIIRVERCCPGSFRVTITEGASKSSHTVSLSREYYEMLTGMQVSQEVLIEQSFQFLLENEPRESILQQFDLPLIGRYFPDYESEIRRRLAG
ncbi:MAG TPA: hypothetical protein VFQ24_14615 [Terriglobia bacterium]|nr:hypothetical protein [Terriglobia bacterium]